MDVRLVVISAVLVIALAGCGSGSQRASSGTKESSSPSSATARHGSGRASSSGACGDAQARRAFTSFLAAFNRGDYATLDSLFAAQPAFVWFSSNDPGTRLGKEAERRDTLVPYFRRRHSEHDRLRQIHLTVTTAAQHSRGLGFELRRSAADFRDGKWLAVSGKASLTCHGGRPKFRVISLGAVRDSAG